MGLLIIGLILGMFVLDLVISIKNYNYRNKPLPKNVETIYDKEKYQKWLGYTMENMRFGLIQKTFFIFFMIALLVFGVFGLLQDLTSTIFSHPLLQTLSFLGIYLGVNIVISIPFNYYETFFIEEKYGFNKKTKKIFVLDIFKGFFVTVVLLGGITALFNLIYLEFANNMWLFALLAWLVMSLVVIIMFVLYTKVFVKIFNKLTPLEEGDLKSRIEDLAKKAGFSINAISVMDASKRSTKLNAFFSGLGKTREVVLYDTLMEKMSDDEILAVLAHELGHAMHKDAPKMIVQRLITFGLYALVLGWVMQTPIIATSFGLEGIHLGFGLIIFSAFLAPINFIISIPLNFLSRKAEYAADAFSAKYVDKKHMKSALITLVTENYANLNPHPIFVMLKYSHPPIHLRLEAIEGNS